MAGGNIRHDAPPAARRPPYPRAPHPQAAYPPAPYPPAPYPQPTRPQGVFPQVPPAPPAPEPAPEPGLDDGGAWAVIRQSAATVSRNRDAFFQQLHYDVTSLIPDLAAVPGLNTRAFCRRMAQTLLWVALTDQPLDVVTDTLRQLGAENWAEGFPGEQYVSFAHALVQTVHYISGSKWSASTGSAWISFFMWIKPYLLAGAEEATAQYAAARQIADQQAAAQRATAEREAARVKALSRDSRGHQTHVVGDVNLERVGSLLDDDDDDEDVGYGHLMVSMTRNPRRGSPRHTS